MKHKLMLFGLIALLCVPSPAMANEEPVEPAPHILIVEVQTASQATGSEEFVEIYNPGNEPIDITGWRLQYRPASAAADAPWLSSHTKATVACEVPAAECQVLLEPQARLVFAKDLALENAQPMTGGFAAAGGQLRVAQPVENMWETVDLIGYGTAAYFEGTAAAPAPDPGQTVRRLVFDGAFVDTNDNAQDFFVDCAAPSPGEQTPPLEPNAQDTCQQALPPDPEPPVPAPQPPDPPAPNPDPEPAPQPQTYLPLHITEVFPDPAPPQQDSTHEFVEIFNPNAVAVEVEDYVLLTGSTLQNKVVLGALRLEPHSYAVVSSGDSTLSLSNGGTAVRLLDPNGAAHSESPNYGKAASGQSWAQDTTGWHWSTTPTPAAANQVTAPAPAAAAKPKATVAKAAVKTAATAAPALPTPAAAQTASSEEALPPPAPNLWVLGLVGLLALGYGVYEYRHGMQRTFQNGWARLRSKSSGVDP